MSDSTTDPPSSPDLRIRHAVEDDLSRIKQLIKPYIEQRKLLQRTDDELRTLTRNGFCALLDDQFVGFVAVEIYSRKMAEIQCLAVHPIASGLGIGKMLIQRCVQCARENDIVELMAITASEALFKDCGFDYSLPDQKKALFFQPGHDSEAS